MIRFGQSSVLLWWLVLPLLALAIAFVLAHRGTVLARLGRPVMVKRLSTSAGLERRILKAALVLVGGFFLVLAWARPQWGRVAEPVTRRGVDVVIALDLSTSMLAEDVAPNRLDLAKAFAAALSRRLEGNRVGLVAFAGSAFPQCPLTLDSAAVHLFLDIMEVGDVPDVGSNLEEAIEVGLAAFPEVGTGHRVLVLVTDGERHRGNGVEAARRAAAEGVVIYTVGTGTHSGGPIPLRDADGTMRGYKKDRKGRVVTSRLDYGELAAIAKAGGGHLLQVSATLAEARRLGEEIDRMEKAELSSRIVTTYKDRFQLPLLLALGLIVSEALISPGRRFPESR